MVGTDKENAIESDNHDLVVTNVLLPHKDPELASRLWRVECRGGQVISCGPMAEHLDGGIVNRRELDAKGSIMLPSLCHSHIHLDKCFILDKCGDLVSGDFEEALKATASVKASFPLNEHDLYCRAQRLISDSLESGVTSMRAHVEVDTIVGFTCLNVALRLQKEWFPLVEIQVCVFAQEPLFNVNDLEGLTPGENYCILSEAVTRKGVSAVGSAPYVEISTQKAKANIDLIVSLALTMDIHADFHLDYNVDPTSEPMINHVIRNMHQHNWNNSKMAPTGLKQRVTIGHATRLQLYTPMQWRQLAESLRILPISIVGLPQSDMYMMGREHDLPLGPPRTTLRVPQLAKEYGVEIAMSVNNIENPFTPQGSVDPMTLCPFGAAIFQAATPAAIRTLIRSVTIASKLAIGQSEVNADLFPTKGDPADFVILHGNKSIQSAALNPSYDRTTIRAALVVARRRTERWNAQVGEETHTVSVTTARDSYEFLGETCKQIAESRTIRKLSKTM